MFLVELVMQGVRGFRELARLRFQRGFNLVAAGNEAGKTTAVDSVQRLLFPDHKAAATGSLVSRYAPDASRGALVVCSDDGLYFRVIQDFSKQAVNLSQYNAASKEFTLLQKEWEDAAQFMAKLIAGVSEEDYSKVFILRREHAIDIAAPTGRAVPATPIAPAAKTAVKGSQAAPSDQARLAELREMLRKAEEAADADYRFQTAKLALEGTEKKLNAVAEADEKLSETAAQVEDMKGCEALPENLSGLLDEQEQRESQKATEDAQLDNEAAGLKAQIEMSPSVNFFTDKFFICGAFIGVLSMAAVFTLPTEYAGYFPIGIILALMLVAVAWYNGSRKNAQRNAIRKEAENLEKERAELEKKFEHESAAITACMRAVGAANAAELKEKVENFRYFQSLHQDRLEQRQRVLGEVTLEELQQLRLKQQEELRILEEAAKAVAKYNVDTYSLRQDIDRLQESSSPAEARWDFGTLGEETPVGVENARTGSGGAGLVSELNCAARIGGIEMETLVPAVEAAAQRNLAAVTNGKYVRIEVAPEGGPIVHTKDDEQVHVGDLSHATRALVYFCLRSGIVEALVGKRRLPFIVDDALAGFDPARQQAACQVLRALAAKTQVIFFTSNPALKAAGDAAAELK